MHLLTRPQEPECLESLRSAKSALNWSHVTPEQKAQIRARLFEMQGKFCAYCERHITDEPAHAEKTGHIEHFRKRRDFPELTFAWSNLFYSCSTPSTCGKYKDQNAADIQWDLLIDPCVDNPEDYLAYTSLGDIVPREGVSALYRRKAIETIRVFHLQSLRPIRAALWKRFKWLNQVGPDETINFAEVFQTLPYQTFLYQMVNRRRVQPT